jgi:hypothetical protein
MGAQQTESGAVTVRAFNGPVISMKEIKAAQAQYGASVAEIYLKAEDFRRRLDRLGAPLTEEEESEIGCLNDLLRIVNEEILREKSPDYERARQILKGEAQVRWSNIVYERNIRPAVERQSRAGRSRGEAFTRLGNETHGKVKLEEAKLLAGGVKKHEITKRISKALGISVDTVREHRKKK